MATTPPTTPLLHRYLGIGLVVVAAVFVFLRSGGIAPLSPLDSSTPVIAYALAGLSVVLLSTALILFKPRVPTLRPGQSVEQYWTTPDTTKQILPVWFLLEAAGTIANVGYFLTGESVSVIAMGVALVAFWWCGPNAFAKV